jgi:hypothetical protein
VQRSVVVLLLLAFVPAACGSTQSFAPPSLAEAATKSSNASSMKFDMSMAFNSLQLTQPVAMTASGAADNAGHRMRMTIDMSKYASGVGGAATNPADWRGTEIADLSNGRLIVYMSLPFLRKLTPGGKPWIKMDLDAIGKRLGVDFSQLTNLSVNPAQMLDWLRATSGSITKIGAETVGGVQTTHYHATVDLAKYPRLVPPSRRAAMRRTVDALTKLAHVSRFPADAWVGADGLVRKLHVAIRETVGGQPLEVAVALRFHDFGTPVHVTVPPSSQTVDFSKLEAGGTP